MFRWISKLFQSSAAPRHSPTHSQRQSLTCEALEDRFVPATLPDGRIFLPLINTEEHALRALGISTTAPQITFGQQSGLAFATSPAITGTVTPGSSLQASVDGGAFVAVAVNAQGQFTFTPSANNEAAHTVVFQATGNNFLSTTANFTYIIDNTAPVIGANQTFNINENLPNSSAVGTVSANDSRPLQSWTITGGNTNGAFAINATTGQITVNNTVAIDREATAAFTLQVSVSDGVNTGNQTVTVTLNDVNDVAPIVNPNLTLTIAENTANGTVVGTANATDGDVTATTFQNWTLTGGNGAFAINGTTGQITVANSSLLDREARANITVQLRVSDGLNLSGAQNVTITLTDVNDTAPVIPANQTLSLGSGVANGTVIGTANATDADLNTTFQNWTLTGGNGAFAINATTGQITILNNTALSLPATVQVSVSDGVQTSALQNVTISQGNTHPPVIPANQTFTLSENSANGTPVGTANVTDADGPTTFQNWTIFSSNATGAFAINATTGQITVANASLLDRETRGSIRLELIVSDGANPAAPQNVTINLTDVNDVAPVVTANQTFTLPENSANGTVVGAANATDADVSNTTFANWTIASGNANGAFAINATTGQIRVANTTMLDREARANITLGVTVSDGVNTSAIQNITINLSDLNDTAPVVTANQTLTLPENSGNGTVVGSANATDADLNTTFQNWTITGGNANGAFAINATTGQITVANSTMLDREARANITLAVTVSDGAQTSAAGNITVNLSDVNDVTPVVTANQSFTLPQNTANGSLVGTANATDGDVSATTFQNWTITSGNANGAFSINATTGQIRVANSTAITSNFTLQLTVSDGIHVSGTQNITITVTPNLNAPAITANQTFTLDENSGNGTAVGAANATDADGPTTFQNWTITGGNTNGAFAINATSGQITVANSTMLDREALADFTLQLTVTDGLNVSAPQNITITLNDVNDVVPVIDANQSFTLDENSPNGTFVGTATAFDNDISATTFQNWNITSGNTNGAFVINSVTGNITVANATALNRENVAAFTLNVTVSDGVNTSAVQSITINLNDVNDVTPSVVANQTFTLPENSGNGAVVGTANATDGDVSPTTFQNWTITGGNANGAFAINATTGQITVANSTALDREARANFTLSLTVSDGPHVSGAQNITINLSDLNDVAPVVTANQTFTLAASATNGAVVGMANATDGDVTPTTFQNWTITSGNANGAFAINATTGQITVANSSALAGNFTLALTVSDGVQTSAAGNVAITLDTNASPPVVTANQTFSLDENSINGFVVGSANATDPDGPTTFQNWTITGGNANGAFAINATTGQITVANSTTLDREARANFTLSLTVSDGTLTSAAGNITINLNDVNDVVPVIPANQTFTLAENSANGTVVGDANATDGDVSATTFQNWTITGGNDNGAFAINATTGEIVVVNDTALDREARANFTLQITVSDGVATSAAGNITIELTDENDVTPVISANQSFPVSAVTTNGTIVGAVVATDGDITPTTFQAWSITAGNTGGAFDIDANTGQITVANSTAVTGNFTLSLTVSDGLNTSAAQTVDILVNAAPVVTLANTSLDYIEDDGPVLIDGNLTLSDSDSAQLVGATVTLTGGDANDALGFVNQGGITGNIANGTLTLTGNANLTAYQTALRSITYTNNSNAPTTNNRTLSIVVNDGTDDSLAATRTITITPVNDAPIVTLSAGNGTYNVGSPGAPVDANLTITDVDSANLTIAVLFFPGTDFISGEDILSFTDTANITGSYDPNSGILQLTGTDTVANYQAALRSVTFSNNNANTALTSRTISMQVSDGEFVNDASTMVDRTIQFLPSDSNAPIISPSLANDTGFNTTDRITANATFMGTVADASNITVFRAGFDGQPVANYVDVLLKLNNGTFTLDANDIFAINNNATLADGNHTLHLIANDSVGNSGNASFNFTLDTVAPDIAFALDPDFDSAPQGDGHTNYNNVTVQGTVEPNSFVTVRLDGNLVQPPFQTANGSFTISGIALSGVHTFTVEAEDPAGNINNTFSLPVTRDIVNLQIVSGTPDNATVASNGNVAITVDYGTDPANGSLSGLALRLHFNSSNLTFVNPLQSLLTAGSPVVSLEDDTSDLDNDNTTDKFILVTWLDAGNAWPGSPTATLYVANFTGAAGFIGSTKLRFTGLTAAGYDDLFGPPIIITFN